MILLEGRGRCVHVANKCLIWKQIIAVIDATSADVKRKPEKKKSGLYGIEPLTSTIRCSGRTTSLYLKKPRNRTGMRALTLQAFPDNWKQVMEFFSICMQHPFGYIMMDLHPASDHILFDCGRTSRKRTDLRSCIIAPHEVKKDRSQFPNGSLVCQ